MTIKRKKVSVGDKFGMWSVISLEVVKNWHAKCRCDCGVEREVMKASLNNGTSTSCGCARSAKNSARETKHGRSGRDKTYQAWANMKARCTNPANPNYEIYGGRGILFCDRWVGFDGFLSDMGDAPTGHTLERKDTNLGYSKENCAWVVHKENCQNTRHSKRWHINGNIFNSLSDASKALGISQSAVIYKCDGKTINGKYFSPHPNCWSEKIYEDKE